MKLVSKFLSLFNPKPIGRPVYVTREETIRFFERAYIGARMANGDNYDAKKLVMSHPSFPLGSIAKIEYTSQGGHLRSVMVEVTDRPLNPVTYANAVEPLDVSWAAFRTLENSRFGKISVRVTLLG